MTPGSDNAARGAPATGRAAGRPTGWESPASSCCWSITWFAFSKDIPFTSGYRVTGIFSSSTQLRVGDPVRVAGVEVGKVKRISPGPGQTQAVEMELARDDLAVHRDATVRIRPRLLLEGSYFVDLSPESPSAPVLASSGVLPLSQSSTSVKADQIFGAFRRPSRESLRSVLHEFAIGLDNGGGKALGDASRQIAPTLKYTAQIAQALQGTEPHDLSRLIAGAAGTTAAFAESRDELADLATQLNRTTGALASQDDALAESISQFDGLMRETPRALSSFDRAAGPIQDFTAQIRPALRAARPVLPDAEDLVDQVRGLVKPGELPEADGPGEPHPAGAADADRPPPAALRARRARHRLHRQQRRAGPEREGARRPPVHRAAGMAGPGTWVRRPGQLDFQLRRQRLLPAHRRPGRGALGVAGQAARRGRRGGGAARTARSAPVRSGSARVSIRPFRPDEWCTDQDVPDLSSRDGSPSIIGAGAGSPSRAPSPVAKGQVRQAVQKLIPRARRRPMNMRRQLERHGRWLIAIAILVLAACASGRLHPQPGAPAARRSRSATTSMPSSRARTD